MSLTRILHRLADVSAGGKVHDSSNVIGGEKAIASGAIADISHYQVHFEDFFNQVSMSADPVIQNYNIVIVALQCYNYMGTDISGSSSD